MKIFFTGALTALAKPDKTKEFYLKFAQVAQNNGFEYFWAFLHGTDPIANPQVSPQEVYQRDMKALEESDLVIAYLGEKTTGGGLEIERAYQKSIPVYVMYEKSRSVSRMARGCPGVEKELVFENEQDALGQLDALLKQLKIEFEKDL